MQEISKKKPNVKNGTVAKSYRELQKGYFLMFAALELSS
ncbi:hypothetical protein K661_03063 [Piscirickettsia salmonis LF-89 = ATCC VR-1361]|nr:hypothetical protein K661_03063 [Piscirickettsia salmonis LF-89 = ATCC VR-1361]